MAELEVEIPNYSELDLLSEEWQAEFKEHWAFRSPSNDWYKQG